jgi:hypothetical protein
MLPEQLTIYPSYSRHYKYHSSQENFGAAKVELTATDMQELETAFAKIEVLGKRAPETLLAIHDIGANLGSSSIGTNGKSALPKAK